MVGFEFLDTKKTPTWRQSHLMDSGLVLTAYNNSHCEEGPFPHATVAI